MHAKVDLRSLLSNAAINNNRIFDLADIPEFDGQTSEKNGKDVVEA